MKRIWLLFVLTLILISSSGSWAQAQQTVLPGYAPLMVGRGNDYVMRVRTFDKANQMEIRITVVRVTTGTSPNTSLSYPFPPDKLSTTLVWTRAPFYDNAGTESTNKYFRLPLGQFAAGTYRLLVGVYWDGNKAQSVNFEMFEASSPTNNPSVDESPIYAVNDSYQQFSPNTGVTVTTDNWRIMPSFMFQIQ